MMYEQTHKLSGAAHERWQRRAFAHVAEQASELAEAAATFATVVEWLWVRELKTMVTYHENRLAEIRRHLACELTDLEDARNERR